MKILVSREILLNAIQTVQNIVSPRTTLPILGNILLEAHDNNLTLITTDLDVGISCAIPVNIQEDGSITLPSKKLSDIIKELPEIHIFLCNPTPQRQTGVTASPSVPIHLFKNLNPYHRDLHSFLYVRIHERLAISRHPAS